jgi:GTP-binding protein
VVRPPVDSPQVVVAIAGRPNAGKSTLFNRLFGRRLAIVDDTPGVTRDANRAVLEYEGRAWEFVDTGGIEETALGSGLAERVQAKSLETLRTADAIVHLVDGQAGLSAPDRAVAERIRALGVPTLLVVNKIDRPEDALRALEFTALGEGDPVVVSSAHGRGVGEMWEALEALVGRAGRLPPAASAHDEEPAEGEGAAAASGEPRPGEASPPEDREGDEDVDARDDRPPRIALVGRPNVGKSSLLNRLAGFERALVDSVPGTTRDPIDVRIERGGRSYVVVDTAGLRRPARIHETIEGHAASASVRSIERAEVAVLVLDATVGVTDQDLRVADLVWRRGRGFVVAVNKADLAPSLAAEQCHETILRRLPQWPPVPLVRLSALEGTGLGTLFAAIDTVVAAYRRRFPTPRLNDLLHRAVEAHAPPLVGGKAAKLMYAAQVRRGPHEVALFASRPEGFATEYLRYLGHRIREEFGLAGVPVKLDVRARPRPVRERPPGADGDATKPDDKAPRRRRPRKGSTAKPARPLRGTPERPTSRVGRPAPAPGAPRRGRGSGPPTKPGRPKPGKDAPRKPPRGPAGGPGRGKGGGKGGGRRGGVARRGGRR